MKKLSILLTLLTLSAISAQAHIDSNHTHTRQFFLNSGYSAAMEEYAGLSTRDPYAPTDDIYPERSAKRFFKNVWKKIDPAAFPEENDTWHDIKMNAGFYDLN
ncbi:MAG: hypothetical protein K6C94_10160 [Candidatus Gastranaerophilales bacterium]|nr:hypothetical protein [Candidatus Gastranaerophilales bacterium]